MSYDFTPDASERATRPLQPDKSLSELFGEMTTDVGTLVRKEVELAKVEVRDELKRAGRGAGMFAGAGLGGWMAALFLSLSLAWLIDQGLNTALSFAIVGVVWAIVALILLQRGKQEIEHLEPLPQTVETLKEDVAWARAQKS